jgi:hypothetical protein
MIASEAIQNLLLGATPERSDELRQLMATYRPQFELARDKVGTTYVAIRDRVVWDHKSIAHDWLVTFAAWAVFRAYYPVIFVGRATGGEISCERLKDDPELEAVESEFDSICYTARGLRLVADFSDFTWPAEIPEPTGDRTKLATDEERACFDIATFAAAATFLHELAHVQFWTDGNAPLDAQEEERQCDAFSHDFLLSGAASYATGAGQSEQLVISKRVMGLATAAFIIDESSRGAAAADTHPTSGDRFRYLVLNAPLPQNDNAWFYTASLMLAAVRRRAALPPVISFNSAYELCERLAVLLD